MKTDLLKFNSICSREWPHVTANEPHILPIYNTSAFVFDNIEQGIDIFNGDQDGFVYSRYDNPTLATTGQKLAALESIDFEEDAHCILTGSGMGAISTMFYSVLSQGDIVLTHADLYGGTTELIQKVLGKFGVKFMVVDFNNKDQVASVISKHKIKLIYIETPSNPLLSCIDLYFIKAIANKHNILTAIDNTFATPMLQRPFNFGMDYIIYSTTKYLNGLGNSLGGAVITMYEDKYKELWQTMKLNGTYCSPTDAWHLYNGLKTFPLRMKQHCSNAQDLAKFLESHPKVLKVNYPGLESHTGHEIAKNQMADFGGMLNFEVDGNIEKTMSFLNALEMATLAPTLGNTDTILLHPATSSHLNVPKEMREKVGISDGLVRVSVGIEDKEDLIFDFARALDSL